MFGWVETHMGPGANERSNGLFDFGFLDRLAVAAAVFFTFAAATLIAIA
jgi:hypothetical protein